MSTTLTNKAPAFASTKRPSIRTSVTRRNRNRLAFCATAAILLPAHPSFQPILTEYGIPSALISFLFGMPVLYAAITNNKWSRRSLAIILLFFAFMCWMLMGAIVSPAMGLPNFFASLRGIWLLMPLALLCAMFAAKEPLVAAWTIFIFGALALVHYLLLWLFIPGFGASTGFNSLGVDAAESNYQATSFYFGFVAIASTVLALSNRRLVSIIGVLSLIITLTLMGTVGARASIVAVLAAVLIIALFTGFNKIAKPMFGVVLPITLFGIIALALGFIDIQWVADNLTVTYRFEILTEGGDPSHRLHLFSAAIQMWLSSPWNFLFGGGLGSFPAFIGETSKGWYPHNFILESLAEGGIVAGLLLFWIARLVVRALALLRSKDTSKEYVYIGGLAVYAVTDFQFMGGLQTIWIPVFFVALFLFHSSERRN